MTSRGFADVTYDEAMHRARALVPALRERADGAETARQMEKDTLDDLHRAGLFRFHQPRRWGGMELPFVAIFDIPHEIARGCASTAGTSANLGIHHWMLALYDERAQEEVWGADPDALIASGIAYPQGRGRRVDGGFVVSGFWNFSSGVDPAGWNMLAVTVRDGERVVDHRMCLVPRGDYEIVDDWQVLGMRSTGSKSVRANDVFVPEHRALCMYLARGGNEFPGAARQSAIRSTACRCSALGSHCLAGAGVGNAQAALDLTIEAIKERSTSYTGHAHARLPGGAAPRGARGRPGRRRAAHHPRRTVSRPSGSRTRAGRRRSRRSCASSATWRGRWSSARRRSTRCTRWPAPTASTTAIRSSASSATSTRWPAHIGFCWDAQGGPWALVAMGGEFTSPTM